MILIKNSLNKKLSYNNRIKMSGRDQTILSQEIQALETMLQQLDSEMMSIEANIECETLKRITMRFLQVLKDRAETKIRLLRESQS